MPLRLPHRAGGYNPVFHHGDVTRQVAEERLVNAGRWRYLLRTSGEDVVFSYTAVREDALRLLVLLFLYTAFDAANQMNEENTLSSFLVSL